MLQIILTPLQMLSLSELCQIILRFNAVNHIAPNYLEDVYYLHLAAKICLLDGICTQLHIPKEQISQLTEITQPQLLQLFSLAQLQGLTLVFSSAPENTEIDELRLNENIKLFICISKKVEYKHLFSKLSLLQKALSTFSTPMLSELEMPTPLRQAFTTSEIAGLQRVIEHGYVPKHIQWEALLVITQEETAIGELFEAISLSKISVIEALRIPKRVCVQSALSEIYMQNYVRAGRISVSEALSISKKAFEACALSLMPMHDLFYLGIMSIAEGLALSKDELNINNILASSDDSLTPVQLFRKKLYKRYELVRDCIYIDQYYLELTIFLKFKEKKTSQELRLLDLFLRKNIPFLLVERMVSLEYKSVLTPEEQRELNLYYHHCFSDSLLLNHYKLYLLQSMLKLEQEVANLAQSKRVNCPQLQSIYFELTCEPCKIPLIYPPLLPSFGVFRGLKFNQVKIFPPRHDASRVVKQQMNYEIREKLVKKYVQKQMLKVNPIRSPANLFTLPLMQRYIEEKVECLRARIVKCFIDNCLVFSQAPFDAILYQIRTQIDEGSLTLQTPQIVDLVISLPIQPPPIAQSITLS